ncbi:MAG: sugar nucleotide-binding protein [Rhodopirellula sp.]|nr:sugar nucleotide-binding protein [Rhodopirellula sp.]
MNNVLIVGIEGAAGAGLATVLKQSHAVVGLTNRSGINIAGCGIIQTTAHDAASIQRHIQSERPDWIIFCGSASRSSWDSDSVRNAAISDAHAVEWSRAAADSGIEFCMISSDAVFSGPWMLHKEDDGHFCATPQAERLRQIELTVLEVNDDALIVRTNAFGWGPDADAPEFVETLLNSLNGGLPVEFDFLRHASPILATDLGRMILKAHEEQLRGVLHLCSSERINPFQFAERLAEAGNLARPEFPDQTILEGPVTGFGKGETTLDCSLAAELLGVRMPLIDDGISQFIRQSEDGLLDSLRTGAAEVCRVA